MASGVLLVLVAHSGRTLQLDVQPNTRVDAVQHALVQFTGIPVADQIAMYQGARLDPTKLLGAYRLPVDPSAAVLEDHPVFLYCRSYLKPGAALPPQEALPPLTVQVPPLAEVSLAHPLHSAASPLVRALPDYERHFQHHLATTRAYWEVAQARLHRCRQLLSEQEVQARAADAARANVEAHYGHILASFNHFMDKYRAQAAAHALLLSTFPSDLAALEAIELHPALQALPQAAAGSGGPASAASAGSASMPAGQPQQLPAQPTLTQSTSGGATVDASVAVAPPAASGGGPVPAPRRLADLYPVSRLREWADTCGRSHASFGGKVAELEALFGALRRDVEGLLQQAPSVDLDSLGRQLSEHEALLDEHSSMVQVLSKDLRTVRALVEDVVRQLGSAAASGGGPGGGGVGGAGGGGGLRQGALNDAAAAMEAIHETHRNRVLPRLAQLDGQLASFAASVEAAKVGMARDVVGQLQRISGQQSRIRDMRHKLAAFGEVLGRQEAAFGELRAVHRLPAAYRALLAEAVRRAAWHQLYCGQAGRLSEHMSRFREKEAGRRTAFAAQVSRYLPPDLLSRAGLASEPPACAVAVPPPAVPIIAVAAADLQRLAYLDERRLAASASGGLRAASSSSASLGGAAAAVAAGTQPRPQHGSLGTSLESSSSQPHHIHHHHGHGHGHNHHHHLHHNQQPGPHQPARASRLAVAGSFPGTVAVLDADPGPPPDPLHALELENARLRAELANHIAAAAIRELSDAGPASAPTASPSPTSAAGSDARPQQQPAAQAAESPSGQRPAPAHRASASGGAAAPLASSPGAAGPGPGSGLRRDPAELVAAMQRALGMKDDLIRQQQREIESAASRAEALEQRIAALEAALAERAGPADSPAEAVAAAGVSAIFEEDAGLSVAAAPADAAPDAAVEQPAAAGEATEPLAGAGVRDGAESRPQAESAGAEPAPLVVASEAPVPSAGGPETGGEDARTSPRSGGSSDGGEGTAAAVPTSPFALPVAQQRPLASPSQPPRPPSSSSPPPPSQQQQQQQPPLRQPPVVSLLGTSIAAAAGAGRPASRSSRVDSDPGHRVAAAVPQLPPVPPSTALPSGRLPAAAEPLQQQPSLAAESLQRGSSGPQAIPTAGGARRRGGSGGNGDGRRSSPYEHRMSVAMPMGSLPFATSLPAGAGSLLPGRLASSPGGGIGLGLALGFGLTSLAEAPSERGRNSRSGGNLGEGRERENKSGSERGSGRGSRRGSDSGNGSEDEGDGQRGRSAAPSPSLRGRRSADGGSSSSRSRSRSRGGEGSGRPSSSGSSLQFQPTWSIMAETTPRAQAGGGGAPQQGPTARAEEPEQPGGVVPGGQGGGFDGNAAAAGGVARGLAESPQESPSDVQGGRTSATPGESLAGQLEHQAPGGSIAPGGAVDAGKQAGGVVEADAEHGSSGGAGDSAAASGSGGGDGSAGLAAEWAPGAGSVIQEVTEGEGQTPAVMVGGADDGREVADGGAASDDDDAVGDVPDIDEVIGNDSAWEVASAGPPAAEAETGGEPSGPAPETADAAGGGSAATAAAAVMELGGSAADAGAELAASAAGDGMAASSGMLDGSQLQLLEAASSGYESVGSVMSAAEEGA